MRILRQYEMHGVRLGKTNEINLFVLETLCYVIHGQHLRTIDWEFKHNWGQPGSGEPLSYFSHDVFFSLIYSFRSQTIRIAENSNYKRIYLIFGVCTGTYVIYQSVLEK